MSSSFMGEIQTWLCIGGFFLRENVSLCLVVVREDVERDFFWLGIKDIIGLIELVYCF